MNKGWSVWENSWHSLQSGLKGIWQLLVGFFFLQCEIFTGGDCSVGWGRAVGSLQQLEVSGCNTASREGWLRCGPACSVMEKR